MIPLQKYDEKANIGIDKTTKSNGQYYHSILSIGVKNLELRENSFGFQIIFVSLHLQGSSYKE